MARGKHPVVTAFNFSKRIKRAKSPLFIENNAPVTASIVYSFIETSSLVNSSPNFTIAAAAIGTASATRRVLILLVGAIAAGRNIVSATIGGITCAIHYQVEENTNGAWSAAISAIVPTGTTAAVTIVMSDTLFSAPIYVVYTIDDSTIGKAIVTATNLIATNGFALSTSYAAIAKSLTIVGLGWVNGSDKSPATLDNYTAVSPNFGASSVYSRNPEPATLNNTALINWSTVATTAAMVESSMV